MINSQFRHVGDWLDALKTFRSDIKNWDFNDFNEIPWVVCHQTGIPMKISIITNVADANLGLKSGKLQGWLVNGKTVK